MKSLPRDLARINLDGREATVVFELEAQGGEFEVKLEALGFEIATTRALLRPYYGSPPPHAAACHVVMYTHDLCLRVRHARPPARAEELSQEEAHGKSRVAGSYRVPTAI